MKITIIYDNMPPLKKGLRADMGFAALVEAGSELKILFDTGANGEILLGNMGALGIEPTSIDEVFISHPHIDHIGGLSRFLEQNNAVKVWVPPSMGEVIHAKEIVAVPGPIQIHKGIYSTGELKGIEQSMAVETSRGLVLVVGCSHPRMENILGSASLFGKVYGIVGGLHSTRPESLRDLDLICAAHCTRHQAQIKRLYPEAYLKGGAGRVIEIQ